MSGKSLGIVSWGLTQDKEGHRNYDVKFLIDMGETTDKGPFDVVDTAPTGVPLTGNVWDLGLVPDIWAYCTPELDVQPLYQKERCRYWTLGRKFTTVPGKRCNTNTIANPLDEPAKVSGSFVKYRLIATKDKDGKVIQALSHEELKIQVDDNRPSVNIAINYATLPLGIIAENIDRVNSGDMWGLPPRCVKFTNCTWSRQLFGTCGFYYTLGFSFDIRKETFDQEELSRGLKCLPFTWDRKGGQAVFTPKSTSGTGKDNPTAFVAYQDANDNFGVCFHDENGNAVTADDQKAFVKPQYYKEADFLALGIPDSF